MRLSKKYQKEEDEINRKLTEANQYWNYCKFQIHYNKIEWVNPRSRYKQKNIFVCFLKKLKITLKLYIGLVNRN